MARLEEPSSRRKSSSGLQGLIKRVVEYRFLRNLSGEKREEVQENLGLFRRLLADQRTPRIAVVGQSETDLTSLLEKATGHELTGEPDIKAYLGHERWYNYEFGETTLELLDLRTSGGEEPCLKAVERQGPDVVLALWEWHDQTPDPTLEALERIEGRARDSGGTTPPAIAVVHDSKLPEDKTLRDAERIVRQRLADSTIPNTSTSVVRFNQPWELVDEIVEAVPMEARLKMTRLVGSSETKKRMARDIIRSSAGLTAAIATLPLPVADIVPITSIQLSMVASVAYLSGKPFELRTVGEFLGAAGLNVGAGFALREAARILVKFIPFAGPAISSGIATAATFGIGNAAVAYFIEDKPGDALEI